MNKINNGAEMNSSAENPATAYTLVLSKATAARDLTGLFENYKLIN